MSIFDSLSHSCFSIIAISVSAAIRTACDATAVKAVGYNQAVRNEMHVHGSETLIIIRIETR